MSTHDPIADSLLVHGNFVHRLARALAGTTADADDLAQATWTAALQADRRELRSPRAWLATIVRNLARNLARSERRRRHHEGQAAGQQRADLEVTEILAREEARRQVVAEVVALSEPLRTVVLLHYFEGLDSHAIGARLGTPASTVRSQLQRALVRLRSRLDQQHGEGRAAWAIPLLAAPGLANNTVVPTAAVLLRTAWALRAALAAVALVALGWWLQPLWNPPPPLPPGAPVKVADAELRGDDLAPTPALAAERIAVTEPPTSPDDNRGPEALWGRVVDDVTGAAVAGAEIVLEHRDADEMANLDLEHGKRIEVIGRTNSDADGEFGFRVRRAVQHRLTVRAAGYATRHAGHCTGGSEFVVRLERPATVTGTVRSTAGLPLADVPVTAFVRGGTGERTTARSAADGTFTLTGLEPKPSYVVAEPPGRVSSQWQHVALTAGSTANVALVVADGRTVRGKVLDAASGAPIVGTRIANNWTLRHSVATAVDGTFELGGLGESERLYLRADGYADQIREVPADAEPAPFEFRLQRGDTIVGRVVDAAGHGLGNAYVAAGVNQQSRRGFDDTLWCAAAVDSAGRFRIDHLPRQFGQPRAWQLLVRAPGHGARVLAAPVARFADGRLDVGELRLAEQGLLEGRVVDGQGNPVADAEIDLRGTPDQALELIPDATEFAAMYHFQSRTTRTVADGSFRIAGLAAGSYQLTAQPKDVSWDVPSGPHLVTAGAIVVVPDLVADAGLTIRGRVRLSGGQPLPAGTALQIVAHGEGDNRYARTAPDGTFVLERLERGEFVLAGSDAPAGYAVVPRAGIAAGSTAIELELAVATTLEGTVVGDDGQPVRGASVYYFPTGVGTSRNVRTDAEGKFRLEVPPGVVGSLGASHPDHHMCQAHQRDVASGTLGIRLQLPPTR